nr:hypothetical protein BaRGS_002135 [Batillaria attramentaria]
MDLIKAQYEDPTLEPLFQKAKDGQSMKSGSGKFKNCRITRWVLALQEFRFRIEPVQGKLNVFADCLSRSGSDQPFFIRRFPSYYRNNSYWLTWDSDTLVVGWGGTVGDNPLVSTEPMLHDILYLGFRSQPGAAVDVGRA